VGGGEGDGIDGYARETMSVKSFCAETGGGGGGRVIGGGGGGGSPFNATVVGGGGAGVKRNTLR